MFRLFFMNANYSPHDAASFKKCVQTPIIDSSYHDGLRQLDSNNYCNATFKSSVPLATRCQIIYDKCLKTPIIDSSFEGGGQEIDNRNFCESEWKKCMIRR